MSTTLGDVWRIVVGQSTVDAVAEALQAYGVQGATLTAATGFWQGQRETSTIIEIAGMPDTEVMRLARRLREWFRQESVYVARVGNAILV